MENITDWLMVGITAVYVLATIAICMANIRSAKSAKEQILESKHQYSETQRLQVMPYLQLLLYEPNSNVSAYSVSFDMRNDTNAGVKVKDNFVLKNLGLGIAHHTKITVTTHYKKEEVSAFDIVIPPGCEDNISVEFTVDNDYGLQGRCEVIEIDIKYDDVVGNTYTQKAKLRLVVQAEMIRLFTFIEMNSPQLVSNSEEKTRA